MFLSGHKVAVFWDYENCAPPAQASGYDAVATIRAIGHRYGAICQLKAYMEPPRQYIDPTGTARVLALRSELQASGVSLTDCPHNGMKEVADHMMQVDMLAFALDHPAPATIMIITGDRDFAYATAILRARCYRVVVLSLPNVHESLKAQADEWIEWGSAVRATEEGRKAKAACSNMSASTDMPRSTAGRTTRAGSLSSMTSGVSSLSSLSLSPTLFPVSDDRDPTSPPIRPPSLATSPGACSSKAALAYPSPPLECAFRDTPPLSERTADVGELTKALLDCSPSDSSLMRKSPIGATHPRSSTMADTLSTTVMVDSSGVTKKSTPSNDNDTRGPAATSYHDIMLFPFASTPHYDKTASVPPFVSQPATSTPPFGHHLPTPDAHSEAQISDGSGSSQSRIVPQDFASLVDILQDQLRLGKQQLSRTEVARLLNQRDCMVYRRTNVANCKQYLALAAQEGFVTLGDTTNASSAWVELNNEWQGPL